MKFIQLYKLITESNIDKDNPFNSLESSFQYAIDNFDISSYDGELSNYEKERVEDYYQKYNEVKHHKNIKIYRAIWANSIDDIDFADVGIYWSFEENGAKPQNKISGNQIFILTAIVSPKQLDWEAGFLSFFYYGEDQWEANLKLNEQINITEINFKTLEKPIRAQTSDTFYSIWGD